MVEIMDYHTLPKLVRRLLKITAKGNATLPSRRQMTTKLFALVTLVPGIASVVMAIALHQTAGLVFIISAIFFCGISLLLFGRKRLLEFDSATQQVYLSTSLWHFFQKRSAIAPFSALTCELTSLGTKGPYQITVAEQNYVFDDYQDAYALLAFLSLHYKLPVIESISNWPSKTPLSFDNMQAADITPLDQTETLNDKSDVYIEIWDRKSLIKLSLPFFFFTVLGALVKYGVL